MKKQPKKHLAAILFTDIEGYSKISNQDPEAGLRMAQAHRDVIQGGNDRFEGECINFYGDGSLSLFSSTENALKAAIEMQRQFQTDPEVPVRIGIHLGEVIRDENSAYGDAVNIAARIQGIAPTNGILVSDEVYHTLQYHRDLQLVNIGEEKLKNISRPIRIYYLNHPDVQIPMKGEVHARALEQNSRNRFFRSYSIYIITLLVVAGTAIASFLMDYFDHRISDEIYGARLAITPFENLTGVENYDYYGQIAADYIIKNLQILDGTEVLDYSYLTDPSLKDLGGIYPIGNVPKFSKAVNLLQGSYTMRNDSLQFEAKLIKLNSGKHLHSFNSQKAHVENYDDALVKLNSEILGYWASKDMKPQSIPNIQAYQNYIKAKEYWSKNDSLSMLYLEKTIEEDSTFLDAYLMKSDWYYNEQQYENMFDWNDTIFRIFTPESLNQRQRNSIAFNRANINGQNVEAFHLFEHEYSRQKDNLFSNTTMAVLALEFVNDPNYCIEVIDEIPHDEIPYDNCRYCQFRLDLQARALLDLEKYSRARKIVSLYPALDRNDSHAQLAMRTLIANRDAEEINSILNRLKTSLDAWEFAHFNYIAAKDAEILGAGELSGPFLEEAFSYFLQDTSRWTMELYFLKGQHREAYAIAEHLWQSERNPYYLLQMALYQAHLGNFGEATGLMAQVDDDNPKNKFGLYAYYRSQVYLALGNKSAAFEQLERSVREGKKFGRDGFHWDPHFLPVLEDPQFQEIIHPVQ